MKKTQYSNKQYAVVAGMDALNMDYITYGQYIKDEYKDAYISLTSEDIEEIFNRVEEFGKKNNIEYCGLDDVADLSNDDYEVALNK